MRQWPRPASSKSSSARSSTFAREPSATLFAPDLRINYGFIPGWEAALEGKLTHGLTTGVPGTSLVESQALLKGVLREGSLQEKPGPSRHRVWRSLARDQ